MKKEHSREDLFLLSMIKRQQGAASPGAKETSGLDWSYLVEKAGDEGVFYPFYKNLTLLNGWDGLVDGNVRERLTQTHYLNLSKSVEFSHQLTETLGRLESLNVRILLFKGPAVDSSIYDGFFRPRLDLDIVVKDDDARGIEDVGSGCPILLHIHRHLINNTFLTVDGALRMGMERVWQETEPFKNYGNIYTLKPELNILYLCEHALKHDLDQLVFLYEIDRLLARYGGRFDWRKFISLAEEFDLKRVVYYGLYFTYKVLSGDVPEEVLGELAPPAFTSGEKAFVKAVLAKRQARYSSYAVYVAARKGLFKKARFVFRGVFPPGFTLAGHLSHIRRLILR